MSSFCLGCGNSLTDGERFCASCGRDSQAAADTPVVDPAVAWGLLPETSGKAIFSLICGIFFIILPFSFIGVIFGYIALSEIRKNPGRLKGRGFAIAGIALSYIGVALTLFVIGLGVYGIRKESKRISQRQTLTNAATTKNPIVTAVRTVNTAEIAYSQRHPDAGYTCSLAELSTAWEINSDLHAKEASRYTFDLKCPPAKAGGRTNKYQLLAYPSPKSVKKSLPVYCSDESAVIRLSPTGTPEDCISKGRELSEKEIAHPTAIASENTSE